MGELTTPALAAKLKPLVGRVEEGVLYQKFNTSIAELMEFVNSWREEGMVLSCEHVEMFPSLLSLCAPQTAKVKVQGTEPCSWRDVSKFAGVDDVMVTIAVQVNGKLRGVVQISNDESKNQDLVMKQVMEDEQVKKWVVGEPKKVVFVLGKLVNLVV